MMKRIIPFKELESRLQMVERITESCDFFSAKQFATKENNKLLLHADEEIYFPFFKSSPTPKKGDKLYRITKYFLGMDTERIASFLYPPKPIARGGRCNIPRNPVFYCSHQPFFSLLETLQGIEFNNSKEVFFLSEWEISREKNWSMLGILLDKAIPPENNYYSVCLNHYGEYKQKFLSSGFSTRDFITQNEFLHTQFLKNGDHRFSSISSHEFLYGESGQNDLVIYPSVQGEKRQSNLAFNTRSLHGDIKFNYAIGFCITDFTTTNGMNFFVTGKAKLESRGSLLWSDLTIRESQKLLTLFAQDYNFAINPITF